MISLAIRPYQPFPKGEEKILVHRDHRFDHSVEHNDKRGGSHSGEMPGQAVAQIADRIQRSNNARSRSPS
jgi:hypothetical protein